MCGEHFLLDAADRKHFARQTAIATAVEKRLLPPTCLISPVHADSVRILRPVSSEKSAITNAQPADGPSFAIAPAGM